MESILKLTDHFKQTTEDARIYTIKDKTGKKKVKT